MQKNGLTAMAAVIVIVVLLILFNRKSDTSVPATDVGGKVKAIAEPLNAPVDKPKNITPDMQHHIADLSRVARKALPGVQARFQAGLPDGQILSIVTTLRDAPMRRSENAFIQVLTWQKRTIHGVIVSEIINVTRYKTGDPITITDDDVVDWCISRPDGTEEGNTVGKYMDTVQQ